MFKVALVAFDCGRGQGPGYFDDVLVPVHIVGSSCRVRVRVGQRSFRLSASSMWNDLPSELKNSDISSCLLYTSDAADE